MVLPKGLPEIVKTRYCCTIRDDAQSYSISTVLKWNRRGSISFHSSAVVWYIKSGTRYFPKHFLMMISISSLGEGTHKIFKQLMCTEVWSNEDAIEEERFYAVERGGDFILYCFRDLERGAHRRV